MSATPITFGAPGKLLLFGEHVAVFGYPAVGTVLDRRLTVTARDASAFSLVLADSAGDPVPAVPGTSADRLQAFCSHVRDVVHDTVSDVSPAQFLVQSELPVSSGFGSSAALCTAIARWAYRMRTPDGTNAEDSKAIWRLAHRLEQFFHGTPSGIDTGLATLGGVQGFRFSSRAEEPHGRPPHAGSTTTRSSAVTRRSAAPSSAATISAPDLPTAHRLPGHVPPLVVGSIPRSTTTRDLVEGVRRAVNRDGSVARRRLERLGLLAEEAIAHLEADDLDAETLGNLADDAQDALAAFRLSTPALDDLLTRGRDAGAVGGKLSGAGGGGAFFLVCRSPDDARAVVGALRPHVPVGGVLFTTGDADHA